MEDIDALMQELTAQSPDFNPRPLINPNYRWVVRSGLQKAIRRGQVELALWYAEFLYANDEKYAWDVLALIIVEDIGIADPDLLAISTQVTLKSVRERMHAEMLYSGLVVRACQSVKSQACCELNLGADQRLNLGISEAWAKKGQVESILPEDEEEQLFPLMHSEDLELAFIACKVMRQRLRNKKPDALIPVLTYIMEHVDDEQMARAAMMSFERTVDTMNLAVFPLVMQMQRSQESYSIIDESKFWPESHLVKALIRTEAYDMHVREGKMAIKVLYKKAVEQEETWAMALEPGETTMAVGSCVFIQEGGKVDRRLTSTWLAKLKHYQHHNFMLGYGFGLENEKYLAQSLNYVKKHIPTLNELRVWAVSKSE